MSHMAQFAGQNPLKKVGDKKATTHTVVTDQGSEVQGEEIEKVVWDYVLGNQVEFEADNSCHIQQLLKS